MQTFFFCFFFFPPELVYWCKFYQDQSLREQIVQTTRKTRDFSDFASRDINNLGSNDSCRFYKHCHMNQYSYQGWCFYTDILFLFSFFFPLELVYWYKFYQDQSLRKQIVQTMRKTRDFCDFASRDVNNLESFDSFTFYEHCHMIQKYYIQVDDVFMGTVLSAS